MLKIIHCTFVLSTPAFIGDGDQQVADTLRPPSIKGAIRFWWRAVQWSAIRKQQPSDEAALAILHDEESDLFGSTQQKSRVGLKVKGQFVPWKPQEAERMSGVKYLAGQGLYDFKKGFTRSALVSTTPFELTLILDNQVTQTQEKQLCEALTAFGHLGAIGSRARKGFGSVCLQTCSHPDVSIANSISEYRTLVQQFGHNAHPGLPPFTAFSERTRIDVTSATTGGLTHLNNYGQEMVRYRSYGRNGKILDTEVAEQNFSDDHDLVLAMKDKRDIKEAPKRAVFGLPNSYFFSKAGVRATISPKNHERRASPLFCHIHHFASGEQAQALALIPAEFLPSNEGLTFKYNSNTASMDGRHLNPDWTVLTNFMDRFTVKGGVG